MWRLPRYPSPRHQALPIPKHERGFLTRFTSETARAAASSRSLASQRANGTGIFSPEAHQASAATRQANETGIFSPEAHKKPGESRRERKRKAQEAAKQK